QLTLAGGCFWCTESVYIRIPGVRKSVSGYANGKTSNPTYEDVCTGTTGHAEAIQVDYDEQKVGLDELLDLFFKAHDPTTLNRQGNDVGTQYRSGIYYADDEQKRAAEAAVQRAQARYDRPIVTEIAPLKAFWRAEEYHQ